MASLTEVAYYTRRWVKWGGITILTLVVMRWVGNGFITYWRAKHPPPAPPPNVLFGKLPAIRFPQEERRQLVYRLETISGEAPDLGNRSRVFFMPARTANLLALERAMDQAKRLGFGGEAKKLSETQYQWQNQQPILARLTMDILYGSFELELAWQQDQDILQAKNLPGETGVMLEAQDVLADSGLLAADLKNGRSKVTFLKRVENNLMPAVSVSEADLVRVDLFRQNLEEGRVVTADANQGLVAVVFSGTQTTGKRVVRLNYNYFPVNYDQQATYPIKTAAVAWEELKSGGGFVASFDGQDTAVIRKVSLGFFDSLTPQSFLQPVYIFEGDDNFVGYVAAINPEWIQEAAIGD